VTITREQAAQIRAACNQILRILATVEQPHPDELVAWVHDHLIPTPGHNTTIRAARTAAAEDLGYPVSAQRLGPLVPAPRFSRNGDTYYQDTHLIRPRSF
jgi:hypothetical protein